MNTSCELPNWLHDGVLVLAHQLEQSLLTIVTVCFLLVTTVAQLVSLIAMTWVVALSVLRERTIAYARYMRRSTLSWH